jgi:hypothetical protein
LTPDGQSISRRMPVRTAVLMANGEAMWGTAPKAKRWGSAMAGRMLAANAAPHWIVRQETA